MTILYSVVPTNRDQSVETSTPIEAQRGRRRGRLRKRRRERRGADRRTSAPRSRPMASFQPSFGSSILFWSFNSVLQSLKSSRRSSLLASSDGRDCPSLRETVTVATTTISSLAARRSRLNRDESNDGRTPHGAGRSAGSGGGGDGGGGGSAGGSGGCAAARAQWSTCFIALRPRVNSKVWDDVKLLADDAPNSWRRLVDLRFFIFVHFKIFDFCAQPVEKHSIIILGR